MATEQLLMLSDEQGAAHSETLDLIDEIMEATRLKPSDEGFSSTRYGVQAFIGELLRPEREKAKVSGVLVDDMIAEIDRKLSAQVNAIMHNEKFRRLESAWRSLKYLVDHTDFRENNRIELLSVSKDELSYDFEDSPELVKSGLYKQVYTAEYGQFGGKPYGAIIANYEFDHSSADVALLRDLAGVAAMSHAPVIAGVAPSMFGLENWGGLANLRDLQSIFEGMQYTKWQAFRESEDSRYVGLVLPRFLLRSPYGSDSCRARTFNFREATMEDNDFCWGSAAFAFASRLTESFARYRWCANIIGPQGGGTVEDLPLYTYEAMGEVQNKIPTQVLISERREFELAEQGFIALTMRKGSDNAAFFSANSCQKPKTFGLSKEGREAELNYRLSTQLPYMFIMNRLAHYIKVIQREHIGTGKERQTLESELNRWLSQYVTEMDSPAPEVRSRRPLRYAQIEVHDVAGEPGFYSVTLKARPHFKYMGAAFTLSLVGKLDKA